MKILEDAKIISNREIRPDIWSLWAKSPRITEYARPGQFVHVRIKNQMTPLLRRPLSIGRIHEDRLELVYRVVGEGSRLLTKASPGSVLNLLGPVGSGFTIDSRMKKAVLIGGGLGLPPLVFLYEYLLKQGIEARIFLGVRDETAIPLENDDPVFKNLIITSETGGKFRKGLVTEALKEYLDTINNPDEYSSLSLYSCGPWGLINALRKMIPEDTLLTAEVSLEQQMACGIGICQGCAVEVKNSDHPYKLVCSDGPVFPLQSVESPDAK